MKEQNQYGNKNSENKKKRSVGRIVFNVLFYLIMVVLIAVLIFSFVEKLSGKDTYPFFGYRGMIVQSGSMSFKYEDYKDFLAGHDEQFKKNDLVFTRRLKDGEEPELYDIVTFKLGNATVIHRVVEIKVDEATGEKLYITRGDAAPTSDTPKKLEEITGIYGFSMGQFGVVVKFFQNAYGIIALIACMAILTIASLILNYLKKKSEDTKSVENNNVTPTDNNVMSTDTNVIPTDTNVIPTAVEESNPNVIPTTVEGELTAPAVIPSEVEGPHPYEEPAENKQPDTTENKLEPTEND